MKDIIYYYLEDNGQSTTKWDYKKTFHRLDGAAIELADGTKHWYQHDKLHRLDGPAVEYASGRKKWYYKGEWLEHIKSQEQYEKWLKLKVFW